MVVLGGLAAGLLGLATRETATAQVRVETEQLSDKQVAGKIELIDGGIEVRGLAPEQLDQLRSLTPQALQGILHLHVGTESRPAVAGHSTLSPAGILRFEPQFPFEPGVSYLVVVDLDPPLRHELRLPRRAEIRSTRVTGVYPSAPELPENLLRFYVQFSAPMERGNAYRYLRLLDHRGESVADAFLELEQELWDPDGRRLTLLFDPGRIKSGLKPKLEVGSALDVGHHFELVVDASWPDAEGNPLTGEHRHPFRTTAPDYASPDPRAWRLSEPKAGTREPLEVELDEPLDHALLARLIEVRRGDTRNGEWVAGRVGVTRRETLWTFTPDEPWRLGSHRLVIDVRLEDLAGNRIDRLFERDLEKIKAAGAQSAEEESQSSTVELPVRIVSR